MTARANLDAIIAAADALGVRSIEVRQVDMFDRIDHLVFISVYTSAEVDALAAELDLPDPVSRIRDGYRWRETTLDPGRGTTIIVQGAHRARPNHTTSRTES